MNKKTSLILLVIILFSLILSACGGIDRETEIAVIVALTQTAAAQQGASSGETVPQTEEIVPAQTEAPVTEAPSSDQAPVAVRGFQPFESGSCASLNADLSASAGLSGTLVSPVSYSDLLTGETGSACQLNYSATANVYSGDLFESARSLFASQGWTEDMSYGAGGAGAVQTSYRKDSNLCIVAFEFKPIDRALCAPDEFYPACMERLAPEQKLYKLTTTCTTYFP